MCEEVITKDFSLFKFISNKFATKQIWKEAVKPILFFLLSQINFHKICGKAF